VDVFLATIRSRTAKFRAADREHAALAFAIAIRDEGPRFVGALTVQAGPDGSEQREVSAKSCEEVLETFALVIAVAIDPNASLAPTPKMPAQEEASPPPAEPRAQSAAPPPQSSPVVDGAPRAEHSARWLKDVSVGAEARGTLTNDAMLAGLVAFSLERRVPGGWDWVLRLSALRSLESHVDDRFGRRATFTWTAGRLDAQPTLFDRTGRLSLSAGLGMDVGAVQAKSDLSVTRPWVSALLMARARWQPASLLQVEVNAGAIAPLVRDSFQLFGPDGVIFRERPLCGFAGIGAGLRLD
jgi:hypothetical protein